MTDKALFLPLNATYYDAFKRGEKTFEMRVYGPRWNEKTCYYRRHVVLSRGYGKKHRMLKAIQQVFIFHFSQLDRLRQNELLFCYGDIVKNEKIICIHLEPV